jgi:hypothetical protein
LQYDLVYELTEIGTKAEKPLASVKTAVKKSAKIPAKIPSGGQREVRGVGSNLEAEQSQTE